MTDYGDDFDTDKLNKYSKIYKKGEGVLEGIISKLEDKKNEHINKVAVVEDSTDLKGLNGNLIKKIIT